MEQTEEQDEGEFGACLFSLSCSSGGDRLADYTFRLDRNASVFVGGTGTDVYAMEEGFERVR